MRQTRHRNITQNLHILNEFYYMQKTVRLLLKKLKCMREIYGNPVQKFKIPVIISFWK